MAVSTMFRCETLLAGIAMSCAAHAAGWPTLGHAVRSDELAAWDIDVLPDGAGLPPGRGSVAAGQTVYDNQCASCHGTFGESVEYMALAGGIGSLGTSSPQRSLGSKLNYATTLWDYINRAMPFSNAKSLTPNQVYAVTAYILNLNEIIPADAELDQDTLPKVKMPNRHGFTLKHGLGKVDGKPDVTNPPCMHDCESGEISSELPPDFTAQLYGDVGTHFRGLAAMNHVKAPISAVAATDGPALIAIHGCATCHGIDKSIVGPAFVAIAARYSENDSALATLTTKVKQGGRGVWGEVSMPPQPQVPDPDIKTIVEWVVSGAHRE